jgi:predicted SpoU family rRNA methylase
VETENEPGGCAIHIEEYAQKLADLICMIDTDNRGDVLVLAAEKLRRNGQYFTAKRIEHAGRLYGTSDEA